MQIIFFLALLFINDVQCITILKGDDGIQCNHVDVKGAGLHVDPEHPVRVTMNSSEYDFSNKSRELIIERCVLCAPDSGFEGNNFKLPIYE